MDKTVPPTRNEIVPERHTSLGGLPGLVMPGLWGLGLFAAVINLGACNGPPTGVRGAEVLAPPEHLRTTTTPPSVRLKCQDFLLARCVQLSLDLIKGHSACTDAASFARSNLLTIEVVPFEGKHRGSYDPNTNIIELNSTALTNIINEARAAGLSSSDAVTFTSLILVPTLVHEIEHMKFYQNVGGITGLGEGGRFLIDPPLLEDERLARIRGAEIELEMGAIRWLAFPDMSDPGMPMVDIMLLQEGGADALMKVLSQHPTYHRLGSLDPTFDRPIDERVSQIPSANRQLSNYYEEELTRAMRSFNERTPQERIDTVRNLLDIIDSRDHVTSQVAGKIALTTYAWLQKWHPPIFNSIPTDLAERFTSHPIFAAAPDLAARIVLEVHPDMEARRSAFNFLCRTRDDGSALDPGTSTSLAKRAKIVFE